MRKGEMMAKIFGIAVAVVMIMGLGGLAAPSSPLLANNPAVTLANPDDPDIIIITTVEQLQEMKSNLTAHYALGNDIDASDTANWNDGAGFEPVGNYHYSFTGSFDGRGFKITDLYINSPDTLRVGLFGYVGEGGLIENVGLENVDVTGKGGVGGLVGSNEGTVSRSYSTGSVSGNTDVGGLVGRSYAGTVSRSYSTGSVSGNTDVGGLVGRSYEGTVSNSYSTGSANGDYRVGGLVGHNDGTVSNSYSTGSVSGHGGVGGLVGASYGGTVSNSYSTGSVSGHGGVGGLVGFSSGGTVSNSYSTGSVSGNSEVGGLVGWNEGTVSRSYSTGSVSGDTQVGGLVGYTRYGTVVSSSYSTGAVNGRREVGGLVGENYGTVSNCYSTGSVSGDMQVGGLAGWNDRGTVSDSFWDIETSGQATSDGGIGRTTAEMKSIRTYTDVGWSQGLDSAWDFVGKQYDDNRYSDHWDIDPAVNDGYPFLKPPASPPLTEGSGTAEDPFIIRNVENLQIMQDFLSYHYVLGNNIDASDTANWNDGAGFEPVGNYHYSFTGSFDGRGFKITDLYINSPDTLRVGLFGYVGEGGVVGNVGLENVDVTGKDEVGGLVGQNFGTVSKSYSTGSVSGHFAVGGLVGSNRGGKVSNCFSRASVSGHRQVGGLVGQNFGGTVSKSYSTGSVSGSWQVGGLAGASTVYSGVRVVDPVPDSFWDMRTSRQATSHGGTGKTTAEIKNIRTYTDVAWSEGLDSAWDFVGNFYDDDGNEGIWDISPDVNDGYPFLAEVAVPASKPAPVLWMQWWLWLTVAAAAGVTVVTYFKKRGYARKPRHNEDG